MAERHGRGHARREPRQPIPVDAYIDCAREMTKRFRILRDWSKKETGEVCGLSSSMITQWEKGQLNLSIPTLLRLSLAVGLGLDMIFQPKAEGLTQDLIERIMLLDRQGQEVLFPMVEGLLNAQLARQAQESGTHENCA